MRRASVAVGLAAAVALVAGAETASATMVMQKKAKEGGYPATSCLYCHNDKLPKKEAHALNDRGQFLLDQKEKRKAKEVDTDWLKDYVEKK